MFSLCGTIGCKDNYIGYIGLFTYILFVSIILILIYIFNKFIWTAFFCNFISLVSFILIFWFNLKRYICYCGNGINLFLSIIDNLLNTFIIPIFIIFIILGKKFIPYLKKIYKKQKKKL